MTEPTHYNTFDRTGNLVPVPPDIADAIDVIMDEITDNNLDYSTEQVVARALIEDRALRTAGPTYADGVELAAKVAEARTDQNFDGIAETIAAEIRALATPTQPEVKP